MEKRAKEAAQSEAAALLKATIECSTKAANDARSALERMRAGGGAA
jgi:hypothetical protein